MLCTQRQRQIRVLEEVAVLSAGVIPAGHRSTWRKVQIDGRLRYLLSFYCIKYSLPCPSNTVTAKGSSIIQSQTLSPG